MALLHLTLKKRADVHSRDASTSLLLLCVSGMLVGSATPLSREIRSPASILRLRGGRMMGVQGRIDGGNGCIRMKRVAGMHIDEGLSSDEAQDLRVSWSPAGIMRLRGGRIKAQERVDAQNENAEGMLMNCGRLSKNPSLSIMSSSGREILRLRGGRMRGQDKIDAENERVADLLLKKLGSKVRGNRGPRVRDSSASVVLCDCGKGLIHRQRETEMLLQRICSKFEAQGRPGFARLLLSVSCVNAST